MRNTLGKLHGFQLYQLSLQPEIVQRDERSGEQYKHHQLGCAAELHSPICESAQRAEHEYRDGYRVHAHLYTRYRRSPVPAAMRTKDRAVGKGCLLMADGALAQDHSTSLAWEELAPQLFADECCHDSKNVSR